jgi:hypothetical protein
MGICLFLANVLVHSGIIIDECTESLVRVPRAERSHLRGSDPPHVPLASLRKIMQYTRAQAAV